MTDAIDAGRALLAALAGRTLPPWRGPAVEELLERKSDGVDVTHDAIALAHHRTLPSRMAAAVAADGVVVPLADGSTLPRGQAERVLADKEERRVYLPLRVPWERAVDGVLRPLATLQDFTRAFPVGADVVPDDALCTRLTAFLAGTTGAGAAGREHLERAGGCPLDTEAAWRRGVDLPGPGLFASDGVVAAIRLALSSTPAARAPARTTAPRVLAGHVVDDGGTPRLLVAPCVSAARHLALTTGAGLVVASTVDAPAHAPGLALTLVDGATRHMLGQPRDEAARAFRITVATALLWARARAAVALSRARTFEGADAVAELREVTRAACRSAFAGDAGAGFVEALLLPPWPDGKRLLMPAVAAAHDALAAARAARSWLLLREALDEGFVARAHGLRALAELPATSADDATPNVAGRNDARAWEALCGEWL